MAIKHNSNFIYFATSKAKLQAMDETVLGVPYPSDGAFETATTVMTQESASGEIVGQVVGRSRDKQNMTWKVMDRDKWWEINNWLEDNVIRNGNFSFWCKYFNFNRGRWMIRQFYPGNRTCTPFGVTSDVTSADFGKPKMLLNCTVNVIDCGIVEEAE